MKRKLGEWDNYAPRCNCAMLSAFIVRNVCIAHTFLIDILTLTLTFDPGEL